MSPTSLSQHDSDKQLNRRRIRGFGQAVKSLATLGGGGALMVYGLSRRSLGGTALAVAAGAVLYRQVKARRHAKRFGRTVEIEKSVFVMRPVDEVYRFWRNFENFPMFMEHLDSVRKSNRRRSHWEANIPGTDRSISWDADITADRLNELIAWRSVGGSDIYNEGHVRFQPAQNGSGTQVNVRICYKPPMGRIGSAVAEFLNAIPSQFVKEDLRRFKRIVESEQRLGFNGSASREM